MKKVRAILGDELLNGEIIKKGSVIEVSKSLAEYLVRAYSNRREVVEGEVKEEKEVKEVKVEKKASKKSK